MESRLDLITCDSEPIHIPGAIQPHGFLIAFDANDKHITHVSANVETLLGMAPSGLLGRSFEEFLQNSSTSECEIGAFAEVHEGRPTYQSTWQFKSASAPWDAIAHRHAGQIFAEFEPARKLPATRVDELYRNLQGSLVGLEYAVTIREMADVATARVRQLSGFDRVMLYRFDKEWNGEVIAENRRDDLEPFVGLHYPASDIPRQARELYTKNWLRFITDRDYTPSPLVAAPRATAQPLDLSFAVLRSVSPIHLEYLRNMGVHASMSISLLHQGKLWGLIACHHYSPRYVPFDLRKACELLGHFMSLQITQAEVKEAEGERFRMAECSRALIESIDREEDLAKSLVEGTPNLLEFIPSAGAALVSDANISRVGQTPNEPEIRQLAVWLSQKGNEIYATDELGREFGTALLTSVAAGVLAINLGHNRLHQILWFRPERIRTVNWAGDLRKQLDNSSPTERLTPRGSFSLWRETVKGQSDPWTSDEFNAAIAFRDSIVRLMLQRAELLAVANDDLRLTNREREKLLAAERNARMELERLNRLKDEFVATLSHELRTPLNAILGWTQLLQMGEASDLDLAEGLQVIERNAQAQAKMIEDLLEISRIISGRLTLDLQAVNLSEIVEDALESLSVAAAGKQIRIEKLIDPLKGVDATGDPNRLRQVIWNLLSNSIKFTPQGGRIQIVVEKVDSHVEITVADTGIGIKNEFLPLIFERYRQADASISRQYGGLGLGLAIVRNLVELHGGHISVDSPGENLGATFTVSLPIRIIAKSDAKRNRRETETPTASPKFNLEGVHVLVVDDEEDARNLVARLLKSAGCSVNCAGSAEEAIKLATNEKFSLIVSDIGMAQEDGYSFIRNWRSRENGLGQPKTPAVALTAYARADDRRRALMAGFNAHLTKPVDAVELVTIIASMTDRISAMH
jgi:light-regulated signal transduction histidine kinase (bacteriophytochrome)/CheY-like chemotaxis protein